jgi:DNA-binding MarR family transcriptional regulator
VTSATCTDDGRRQLVTLTDKGRALLNEILPVWDGILAAMDELVAAEPESKRLLPAIGAMEKVFKQSSLSDKIQSKLAIQLKPAINE